MNRKRVLVIVGGILIIGSVAAGLGVQRQRLWGKQILNLELFRSYSRVLDAHAVEHGEYPAEIPAAPAGETWAALSSGTDIWGHPLLYLTNGRHYVLASTGRDGRSDFEDYEKFLEATPDHDDICLDWNADQILSDSGWHQVCGK